MTQLVASPVQVEISGIAFLTSQLEASRFTDNVRAKPSIGS